VASRRGVNQLGNNPDLALCFAHAAFQNVAHPQFTADVLDFDPFALFPSSHRFDKPRRISIVL
jgi:hypothetical protein